MYQPVDPPKPCQVLIDGTWRDGHLRGWHQVDGHWRATVWWSEGPGLNHRSCYWADEVRPR